VIQAVVTIVVAQEKRNEIMKSMRSTVGPTRVQPGCVDCRVYVDAGDPNVLSLVQQWDTRADLQRHVRSDLYRTVLAIIESSLKDPEIAIHTISKTEGIEAIEKLMEPCTRESAKRRNEAC
jgi:quinol monooxygenase YgiN